MRKKILIVAVVASAVLIVAGGWCFTHRRADPEEILKRADLRGTSVTYSWDGMGLTFGVRCNVRAEFSGDGRASLVVGNDAPIRVKITPERYRELIQSLATHKFCDIRVKRWWWSYLCDYGRYEFVLRDGGRTTVVIEDGKHSAEPSKELQAIRETLYSFEKEFGQRLDYRTGGTAAREDTREIYIVVATAVGAVLIVVGIAVAVLWHRRRSSTG